MTGSFGMKGNISQLHSIFWITRQNGAMMIITKKRKLYIRTVKKHNRLHRVDVGIDPYENMR